MTQKRSPGPKLEVSESPGKPRPSKANPLQSAIAEFTKSRRSRGPETVLDIHTFPKRYTLYSPLLLLPANFSSHSAEWQEIFSGLNKPEREELFALIVAAFTGHAITNVAINAPISSEEPGSSVPNVMRSPTGLLPMYGDFGPMSLSGDSQPQRTDFDKAFWVSAVQNRGIVQIWAPLWTMFSRGNIGEKARILGEGNVFRGLTEHDLGQKTGQVDIVDFYVGIGYFAFSYLKRGVGRVWGWEISGWSIEGLRRGAENNGWNVKIISVGEAGQVSGADIANLVSLISEGVGCEPRCIVFHGDNKWAADVMTAIRSRLLMADQMLNVRHCNLGLLPTSRSSWEDAVRCLDQQRGGWLHVHENTDIHEIEDMCRKIVEQIQAIAHKRRGDSWTASCCHIEQVKTYAPGVMHCVFDIEVLPAR